MDEINQSAEPMETGRPEDPIVVDQLSTEKAGIDTPAEFLAHVSPLGWEHINLSGEYRWPGTAPQRRRKHLTQYFAPSRKRPESGGWTLRPRLSPGLRSTLEYLLESKCARRSGHSVAYQLIQYLEHGEVGPLVHIQEV